MTLFWKKQLSAVWKRKTKIEGWQLEIMLLYLQAGYSIYDITKLNLFESNCFNWQENSFENWLKIHGLETVTYLLEFLPLDKALFCYLQVNLFKVEFKRKLLKILTYPTIQLVLALGLSLVAQYWVLPLLTNLVSDLDFHSNGVSFLTVLMRIINIGVLLFAAGLVIATFILKKLESSLVFFLLNKPFLKMVKDLIVYQFLNYYLILYKSTDSSETIIRGLRKLPQAKYLNIYADSIHFCLMEGNELAEAFAILDEKLAALFAIAKDTGKVRKLLESYAKTLNLKFENRIKKAGYYFQIFSYVYIMLLVVLVYQMMLLPLGMIERM